MKIIRLTAIIVASLLALTVLAGCSMQPAPVTIADSGDQTETVAVPTLTVTGTGKLTLPPDMATLNLGVQTNAAEASDAISRNAELMDAVMQAVMASGVAQEDIQTENYSMYQNYIYDPNTGANIPGDYNVNNTLSVKVRDISKLGEITDAAAAAGMNQSYGIQFSMQDPDASRDELIALAVADARSQAESYAAALGKKLGEIVSVTNGAVAQDIIYEERLAAAVDAPTEGDSSASNFQEGTLEQSSIVTIRYRLD